MKKLITSCFIISIYAIPASGQGTGNRDLVIWSEDFQNGIPSGWGNTETSNIASWEYRGPNTSPDITVGSRGSCTNNFIGDPIQSTTSSNGFIIFDSNYWDNNALPCTAENMGTGPAPGPHNAQLTTPSIDLTNIDYAVLQFEQYVRYYTGATSVEISIAQGAWATLFSNTVPMGGTSINPMVVRIPLPSNAMNNSDIRFRFNYNGLYYFWQLDDIAVIQVPANDLKIVSSTYGNFDMLNVNNPTGYEYMEYSQYPTQMAPSLTFKSNVYNNGGLTQNNCALSATVIRSIDGTVLYEQMNANGISMNPAVYQNLSVNGFQMPADTGNYQIIYNTHQTETDLDLSNDNDTLGFRISPCVFARDKGAMTAVYSPSSGFWDMPFEISNVYLPTANMRVSAITAGLANNTEITINGSPNQVRGKIYTFTYNDSIISQLYATTPWVNVDPATFNAIGENKFMEIPFPDSIDLVANTPYLVAIENNFGPNHLLVGMSGKADDFTAWHQNSDGYFYVTKIPMIRLQSCFDTTIIYIEDTTTTSYSNLSIPSLRIFPNPSQDYIQIEGANSNESFEIFDTQGRKMFSGKTKSSLEKIDIQFLHPGCYLIQLGNSERKKNLTFIKE
jgi:Secretion system C-terminal sorting domain